MAVLRFALTLLAVVFLHSLAVRVVPEFAVYVDLFLIFTVAWASESPSLVGLGVGLAAGLTADAFAGGPFGLNGFANTLIGYGTSFAVANLAKLNSSGAALLYAVAASVQQLLLIALVMLLIPNGLPPTLLSVVVKIAVTALAGIFVFRGRRKFVRAVGQWRQTRDSRLRF